MSGEIQVAAIASLGGLGAQEGPPTLYNWTPPSLIPLFLPWMGILLLLLMPANRSAQAWWVWVPLLALNGIEALARWLLDDAMPSEALDMFTLVYGALGFGLAGLWLTATLFSRSSRWLTFLGMLIAMAIVGGLACGVRAAEELGAGETTALLVFLLFCVFQVALAFSLSALTCRRRAGAWRLIGWTAVYTAAIWVVSSAPFVLFMGALEFGPAWFELLAGVLAFAGVTFAVVLPFLGLALLVPFYRQRLGTLLQLPAPGAVPVLARAAPVPSDPGVAG